MKYVMSAPLTPTPARECIYNRCDVGVEILHRYLPSPRPAGHAHTHTTQQFNLFPPQAAAVPAMANWTCPCCAPPFSRGWGIRQMGIIGQTYPGCHIPLAWAGWLYVRHDDGVSEIRTDGRPGERAAVRWKIIRGVVV